MKGPETQPGRIKLKRLAAPVTLLTPGVFARPWQTGCPRALPCLSAHQNNPTCTDNCFMGFAVNCIVQYAAVIIKVTGLTKQSINFLHVPCV